MICLCCGKPLRGPDSQEKTPSGWHSACIRRFFGTKDLPELLLDDEVLQKLAEETVQNGYTVPGVQKKLSLHLTSAKKERPRLTLVGFPAGYILKPQTQEYPSLPEAEHLVMHLARLTGIRTVPFALIPLSEGGDFAYITKRVDRTPTGEKLAMEDFCQLDLRVTADKYKGSYERCGKIVAKYSANSGLDMTELFLRLVFSFAVGNSDMHLKNFSLRETTPGSAEYHLAEAYDMLPVNLVLPADKDQMALTLNGKNRNLHRRDFLILAETCGINRKPAEKMIEKVVSMKDTYLARCKASLLPASMADALCALIEDRIGALK